MVMAAWRHNNMGLPSTSATLIRFSFNPRMFGFPLSSPPSIALVPHSPNPSPCLLSSLPTHDAPAINLASSTTC
ncbi:hypothetical protein E2C01_017076 [Portunus trituberculatus]|uniref:Uncharacterized protein n=1 Tax=Portunus trituberculatus TaxID=210409 RepID=A0A5B7DS72_PORTR|nr:hypothetical protein [Portunus trituberculatus]